MYATTPEIRAARAVDYAVLPDVEARAGQVFSSCGLQSMAVREPCPVSYYHALPEDAVVFVATGEAGGILGFAAGRIADGCGYLLEVSVLPAFARQGLGGKLVERVALHYAAQGCAYLNLTTFRDVPFNRPFYEKLGFAVFEPDEGCPELQDIRRRERESMIETHPRVAMRRVL